MNSQHAPLRHQNGLTIIPHNSPHPFARPPGPRPHMPSQDRYNGSRREPPSNHRDDRRYAMNGGRRDERGGGVRLEQPEPYRPRAQFMERQVDVPNYYQRDEIQVPRSYRREGNSSFQRHYREDEEDGPPYRRDGRDDGDDGGGQSGTRVKLKMKEELTDNYRKRSREKNGGDLQQHAVEATQISYDEYRRQQEQKQDQLHQSQVEATRMSYDEYREYLLANDGNDKNTKVIFVGDREHSRGRSPKRRKKEKKSKKKKKHKSMSRSSDKSSKRPLEVLDESDLDGMSPRSRSRSLLWESTSRSSGESVVVQAKSKKHKKRSSSPDERKKKKHKRR